MERSIPPTLVRRFFLVTNQVRTATSKLTRDLLRVPCWRILVGGLFLATGVCAMHYIGMLSMKMNATTEWNWYGGKKKGKGKEEKTKKKKKEKEQQRQN